MKRKESVLLLQCLAAGFLFTLLLPALAVWALSASDREGDMDSPKDLSGKIQTPDTITVWMEEKGRAVSVDFEDYVCRVVASEMPSSFEEEALKAQSVAARTYGAGKILKYEEVNPAAHPKAPVCNTTHCQVYKTEKKLIADHGEGWEEKGWKKIQKACRQTEGQLLYYNGELVMQPLFFSSSGGQTENSEDVFSGAYPYLVSVESPYEEEATHRDEEVKLTIKDFERKVKAAYPDRDIGGVSQSSIKILSRTAGGRVERMQAGDGSDGVLRGTEVRSAAGLSSAMFSIRFEEEDTVVFISSGSGHGVGLSQYGANGMAKEGYTYKEILHHYYSGTQVG